MRKKILIIEDNLVELNTIANELENYGYDVIKTSGIEGADDFLPGNPKAQEFDCFIIDLNMSNTYLISPDKNDEKTKILKRKTEGGALTGWVWLYNIAKPVLTNNPKIIIYSAFTNELEEIMSSNNSSDINEEEIKYFNTVEVISKASVVNGTKKLLETVNKLLI